MIRLDYLINPQRRKLVRSPMHSDKQQKIHKSSRSQQTTYERNTATLAPKIKNNKWYNRSMMYRGRGKLTLAVSLTILAEYEKDMYK